MGAIRTFSKRKRWSVTDEQLLISKYASSSRKELLVIFEGRPLSSIETKAFMLGVGKPKKEGMSTEEVLRSKRDAMARKRAADPEKARQYQMSNYFSNHEARKEINRNYLRKRFFWGKSMKLRSVGRANFKELASIWKSQRGKCALTGRKLGRNAQLDHIVPRAKGGGDHIQNLRWLCAEANLLKRDMLDSDMFDLCEEILRYRGGAQC